MKNEDTKIPLIEYSSLDLRTLSGSVLPVRVINAHNGREESQAAEMKTGVRI